MVDVRLEVRADVLTDVLTYVLIRAFVPPVIGVAGFLNNCFGFQVPLALLILFGRAGS